MPKNLFSQIWKLKKIINGGPNHGRAMTKYPKGDDGYVPPNTGPIGTEFTGVYTDIVDGFEIPNLSANNKAIYVSTSGDDANSGTSESAPVKTLSKAISLAVGGDHILLKRGDEWIDERIINFPSGPSTTNPTVFAFYGAPGPSVDRDRPRVSYGSQYSVLFHDNVQNVSFLGLEFYAYKMDPDHVQFTGVDTANIRLVLSDTTSIISNIVFDDCRLRFVEYIIQGFDATNKVKDIKLNRCIITDKYSPDTSYTNDHKPSGMYIQWVYNLKIDESTWDHNGWSFEVPGAGANMYNHNTYISEKNEDGSTVSVTNSLFTRGSALGVHGRPGGVYDNNFFYQNAIGLQMGFKDGAQLPLGTNAHALNNVVVEGLYMKKGLDACTGSVCTGAVWGINIEAWGDADVKVHNNIVAHSLNKDAESGIFATGINDTELAGTSVISYLDNVVYKWATTTEGTGTAYTDAERFLEDYSASLGGEYNAEAFLNQVRGRGLRRWDYNYSAQKINDYFRAGFDKAAIGV